MATTRLERTNGTATTRTKCTFCVWFKYDQTSGTNTIINSSDDSNANTYFLVELKPTLDFQLRNGSSTTYIRRRSTQVIRDPCGWYNVVVTFDSTLGTPADRVKVFLNGERITDFVDNNGEIGSDYESPLFKTSTPIKIGSGINNSNYFSGVMSHIHATDGYAYEASSFGEVDSDTGEWKIKVDPSVTYGDNGFFILKDGNSVTDQSGEGNNFTVANGSLTATEDCSSDNFSVMNPLNVPTSNAPTFTNSNTYSQSANGGSQSSAFGGSSTLGITKGKFYIEAKAVVTGDSRSGVGISGEASTIAKSNNSGSGGSNSSVLYASETGAVYNNTATVSGFSSYANSDIIGIAIDATNAKLYFSKNGTWENSGDPSAGTGGLSITAVSSTTDGAYFIIQGSTAGGGAASAYSAMYFNFGNGYFGTSAISSEGTNASGIGKFEYDVPTGFTALSTRGLNS